MSSIRSIKSVIHKVGDTSDTGTEVPVTLLKVPAGRRAQVVSILVGNISPRGSSAMNSYITLSLKKCGSDEAIPLIVGLPVVVGEGVQCLVGGEDRLFLEAKDELLADSTSNDDPVSATISYILEG